MQSEIKNMLFKEFQVCDQLNFYDNFCGSCSSITHGASN